MAIVYLNSLQDPRLAPYRDLPGRTDRADAGHFVVEGRFLVQRLAESGWELESILTDAARAATLSAEITSRTNVYVLTTEAIDRIVGFDFHRGMLACGLRRRLPLVDDIVPAAPHPLLLVICSQVADPANLGGILRNCAAFGADAVLLGPGCADPLSRRVLRVSMGAVFKLAMATSHDFAADLRRLGQRHGVTLLATVLSADALPLATVGPVARLGLVIGNEGFGLAEETVRLCQQQVTIPLQSGVDSLNAAVASGVFLYHFRQ